MKNFNLPFTKNMIIKKKELITLTGKILVARDQVHKIIVDLVKNGKKLPCDFKNTIIFYAGPAPNPKNKIIGSIGPTTSSRMDKFVPDMLKLGVKGFIGKGDRSVDTLKIIKKNNAYSFSTFGGYAALLSKYIISKKIIAYKNLGPEALLELEVEKFPVWIN